MRTGKKDEAPRMRKRILRGILGVSYVALLAMLLLTFLRTRTTDRSAADVVGSVVLGVAAMLDLRLYAGVRDREKAEAEETETWPAAMPQTAEESAAPVGERSAIRQEQTEEQGLGGRADFEESVRPYGLTNRELEVARLLYLGCTNRQIAEELFIAETTVKKHATHIYEKMQVAGKKEFRDKLSSLR